MPPYGAKGNQQAESEPYNAEMHLEVIKTINGGIGEKIFFSKKNVFRKKIFHLRNFFHQILYYLGPRCKQEENKCHGRIQNRFSKWVGAHEIFQLHDMSKIWQKHGFLTLANPTLKHFFRRVYRGPLVQM